MTEKRFTTKNIICSNYCVWDNDDKPYGNDEVVDLLNTLKEENEQLKTQLQNTSDQRDEFHRGARENANRVGKLKKENEQLKSELKSLRKKYNDFSDAVDKRLKELMV